MSKLEKEQLHKEIREFILNNPEIIIQALRKSYQALAQPGQQAAAGCGQQARAGCGGSSPVQSAQQAQAAKGLIERKDGDHLYGNPDAPTTLIEYSDFECPYCKRFHPSAKALVDESNGQVNWIYRHLPLPFHSDAMPKALASECAFELGGDKAFWVFADAFLERSVPVSGFRNLAKDAGLDEQKFQSCLNSQKHNASVRQSIAEANGAGIRGTPGNIIFNNKTKELSVISGAVPLASLKQAVQKLQN